MQRYHHGYSALGDFKIKAAKLRGEPSEARDAPFSELGISDDHSGMSNLPADAPLGTDIREYRAWTTIPSKLASRRTVRDCLGIIGVARDVAVPRTKRRPEPETALVTATISDTLPITVEAADASTLSGRVVKGITLTPTPLWDERENSRRCGIRSIDAVVDVTNYVLLNWSKYVRFR